MIQPIQPMQNDYMECYFNVSIQIMLQVESFRALIIRAGEELTAGAGVAQEKYSHEVRIKHDEIQKEVRRLRKAHNMCT